MNPADLIGVSSVLIALVALGHSIRTSNRQKTFENENHFFTYKLNKYNEILGDAHRLLSTYRNAIEQLHFEIENGTLVEGEIEHEAEVIDKLTDKFQDKIIYECSFLPESIVSRLEQFLDNLYDNDLINNNKRVNAIQSDTILAKQDILLGELTVLMRKDLAIATLDKRLKRRHK